MKINNVIFSLLSCFCPSSTFAPRVRLFWSHIWVGRRYTKDTITNIHVWKYLMLEHTERVNMVTTDRPVDQLYVNIYSVPSLCDPK